MFQLIEYAEEAILLLFIANKIIAIMKPAIELIASHIDHPIWFINFFSESKYFESIITNMMNMMQT